MLLLIFLIACMLLVIAIYFSLAIVNKPPEKKSMPENLEKDFLQYCEILLAPLKLNIREVEMSQFKQLAEVPFEDGIFEYYSFDYNIIPEKAVVDSNGMLLNTRELFNKVDIKGKLFLLFFRKEEEGIFEVSFPEDREVAAKGYKGYISARYSNVKGWSLDEEYSLKVADKNIVLWENLKGDAPFPYAVQTRERTRDFLSYTAQFTDTWEGKGIKVSSWIQFEKKRELVYWIKSTNPQAETFRGIHVGSTVQELKSQYRGDLGYDEEFKGAGACYGFIPRDNTNRYIAFFVQNNQVTEIWITDGFDERPFKRSTGYVEDDVKWETCDYSDKLSERYAREIYVGQHKSDMDPEKVLTSFVAHQLPMATVLEHGLLKEGPKEKTYYLICQKRESDEKFQAEVLLRRMDLQHSIGGESIWVADRYRCQEMYES
ncbi:hypothetical protein Ami103574_01375 [Aminipila butyrica]|uniref:Uncharacterized protein n=1 Tax=Aminipila butyrica TaxID=433296 RepID=A0A858BSW6_9FIRM|nr:hypothetical protein [Aminipila butyrica]QIB68040.1 hypothetical protein Ami103574_01375 [Aminipila butyrica]